MNAHPIVRWSDAGQQRDDVDVPIGEEALERQRAVLSAPPGQDDRQCRNGHSTSSPDGTTPGGLLRAPNAAVLISLYAVVPIADPEPCDSATGTTLRAKLAVFFTLVCRFGGRPVV